MKTNFSAILAISFFLLSCSRSEDPIEETTEATPFFNLNVGNEWVYKTYDRPDFNSDFKFNGQIDTLKIISEETSNNKKYYKITHSNRNQFSNYIEYWRVNKNGYLVYLSSIDFDKGNTLDTNEAVKHPGKDYSLIYPDNNYIEYGSLIYKLYPETTLTIDNQNYKVYPFKGQFTPNDQNPNLIPKVVERNYSEGIGLVKHVSHSVSGTYNFEDRLVSYKIN